MRAEIAGARSPCPIAGQAVEQPPPALHPGTLLRLTRIAVVAPASLLPRVASGLSLESKLAGSSNPPSPSEQSPVPRRCQSLPVSQIVMFAAPTDATGTVAGDCNFDGQAQLVRRSPGAMRTAS